MSSIIASGLDRAVLPAALLPIAKSHLRVDGTYDDALITSKISIAINWFEIKTNVSVNPVTWTWTPDQGNFCNGSAQVPLSPVNSFTVDAGGDVSAAYTITTMSTHGVGLYSMQGTFAAGMAVTIPSGYADLAALDPGILNAVLMYTAHIYENREILVDGKAQDPGWAAEVVAAYWVPRC